MIRISQMIHGRSGISAHLKAAQDITGIPAGTAGDHAPVVFWNITNRCNLRCSHCYSDAGPDRAADDDLGTEEMKQVIDEFSRLRVPVLLFSGGEPLVREDFMEIAAYAAFRGLHPALSTNGTLIGRGIPDLLIDAGISYAGISVDSANPVLHDRFRGLAGSHARAMRALGYCVDSGLKCGIRMTVTKDNYRELGDLIEAGLALGVPRFCLYWLVPSGRGKDLGNGQLTPEQAGAVLNTLYRYARDTDPEIMEFLSVDAPQDAFYVIERMRKEGIDDEYAVGMVQKPGPGCSAGTRVINIDARGNVYPCQFAQRPGFLLGNVRETPFHKIWSGQCTGCGDRFRYGLAERSSECRNCEVRAFCGGGCSIRALENPRAPGPADPLSCGKRRSDI